MYRTVAALFMASYAWPNLSLNPACNPSPNGYLACYPNCNPHLTPRGCAGAGCAGADWSNSGRACPPMATLTLMVPSSWCPHGPPMATLTLILTPCPPMATLTLILTPTLLGTSRSPSPGRSRSRRRSRSRSKLEPSLIITLPEPSYPNPDPHPHPNPSHECPARRLEEPHILVPLWLSPVYHSTKLLRGPAQLYFARHRSSHRPTVPPHPSALSQADRALS